MATPDLSTYEGILRGTYAESAGQFEDVQDHLHLDPGLKHLDNGHTHHDNGHAHFEIESQNYVFSRSA